jgi:ribose transport system ATP-binding protein
MIEGRSGMSLLEAKNIVKHFGGVPALSDANLICQKGKITGLLGVNGSGKSTIAKIVTGVYIADSGDILYKGSRVDYQRPIDAKRDGIAMAFQNLSLLPDLKIWQNIVLNFEETRGLFLNDKSARKKARDILDRFIPGFDIERPVAELDSGEKQIVEIAKAVVQDPELLILDEPTAALEQSQVKVLFAYMRDMAAKGVGIIFTSHRMSEVMDICDDVVVFRNGKNVGSVDFEKNAKDPDRIICMITGEANVSVQERAGRTERGKTMLRVEGLDLGRSLRNLSLEVKKGEILGIGGLAGQGQNELMLALAGRFPSMGATYCLDGEAVAIRSPNAAIRKGIVLVPGDRLTEGLMTQFSVYENIILPKQALKRAPFVIPSEKYRKECREIVEKLSIMTSSIDLAVDKLSGGNQQKVVVGKWLPFDVKTLLLADPAKGVDVGAKRDLYGFIHDLVEKLDISVILYASDNDELVSHCDRVLIMYEGQFVSELVGDEISEETIVDVSLHRAKEAV